jgi:hypothetical protein
VIPPHSSEGCSSVLSTAATGIATKSPLTRSVASWSRIVEMIDHVIQKRTPSRWGLAPIVNSPADRFVA